MMCRLRGCCIRFDGAFDLAASCDVVDGSWVVVGGDDDWTLGYCCVVVIWRCKYDFQVGLLIN